MKTDSGDKMARSTKCGILVWHAGAPNPGVAGGGFDKEVIFLLKAKEEEKPNNSHKIPEGTV